MIKPKLKTMNILPYKHINALNKQVFLKKCLRTHNFRNQTNKLNKKNFIKNFERGKEMFMARFLSLKHKVQKQTLLSWNALLKLKALPNYKILFHTTQKFIMKRPQENTKMKQFVAKSEEAEDVDQKATKKDVELNKDATKAIESVFMERQTNVKAGIEDGKVCLQFGTKTQTNSKLFQYNYWKCLIDCLDVLSQRNEMNQAKSKVEDLKSELEILRNKKLHIQQKVERLHWRLTQLKQKSDTPADVLKLAVEILNLKELEPSLLMELNQVNIKEAQLFQRFLHALKDQDDKAAAHIRFLGTSIVFCLILSFILTVTTACFHHFNLLKDLHAAMDKIKQPKCHCCDRKDLKTTKTTTTTTTNQQSWGAYIKGYARPLYSWAMPRN